MASVTLQASRVTYGSSKKYSHTAQFLHFIFILQDACVAKPVRHCALCLKELIPSVNLIKQCDKCKKRVYCSHKCQSKDWSVTGQCHKNWCGRYQYGEEDIDWEVLPVPNKGLGVLAKRFLPAGKRIIVEPVYTDPNDHPGLLLQSFSLSFYSITKIFE